jgi:hypothetical protein
MQVLSSRFEPIRSPAADSHDSTGPPSLLLALGAFAETPECLPKACRRILVDSVEVEIHVEVDALASRFTELFRSTNRAVLYPSYQGANMALPCRKAGN